MLEEATVELKVDLYESTHKYNAIF